MDLERQDGDYGATVCASVIKEDGIGKKCVADNGMAFGNAAGDFFVSGWSGRRKVRSDWEMAAFF